MTWHRSRRDDSTQCTDAKDSERVCGNCDCRSKGVAAAAATAPAAAAAAAAADAADAAAAAAAAVAVAAVVVAVVMPTLGQVGVA